MRSWESENPHVSPRMFGADLGITKSLCLSSSLRKPLQLTFFTLLGTVHSPYLE